MIQMIYSPRLSPPYIFQRTWTRFSSFVANGLMTAVRRYEEDANDVVTSIAESLYTYNANNAVTSITHKNPNGTQIVQHSYTYDNTNNIVEYLNSIDGSTTYNYDFLGQLIGADYASQTDETYVYDSNGNRIVANGDAYTTGTNNELTSDGDYTYTYDAEGNRTSKTNSAGTERELYTWDHRNRLTTVTKQTFNAETQAWTTVQVIEYTYDYNNFWIRKTVGNNSTIFIPENYQTAVQIDNGAVSHHYLWTPNQQDKLLADTTPNSTSWALTDHLGTIRDILGATTTHLIYDAFGNLTSGTNPLLFGYTGKAFDPATKLQNNINRWYDSTVGRWLSTDPIEFEGNDTNLYRYVGNNPVRFSDFRGYERLTGAACDKARSDRQMLLKTLNDSPGYNLKRAGVEGCGKNCSIISFIIELPDPCEPKHVGHTGMGINDEYYDYGPDPNADIKLGKTVPGTQYFDNPDIGMPELLTLIENSDPNSRVNFIKASICVCQKKANKAKKYWENLYSKIKQGKAKYRIPGLHCTSAAISAAEGGDTLFGPCAQATSPSKLLEMLKGVDVWGNPMYSHTCGENKGKPIAFEILR